MTEVAGVGITGGAAVVDDFAEELKKTRNINSTWKISRRRMVFVLSLHRLTTEPTSRSLYAAVL